MTGKKDAKYTTVEGHEIVRDGEYETRDGNKFIVIGFYNNVGGGKVVGYYETESSLDYDENWGAYLTTGKFYDDCDDSNDLMRPWVEKPEKKVYKLSEMRKVWYRNEQGSGNFRKDELHTTTLTCSAYAATQWIGYNGINVLAITRADATEFYEGEGLEE